MPVLPHARRACPADAAETMLDVRAEVDRIDREMVKLLLERQACMDAAARIKPSRDVVRDEARKQKVKDNVAELASEAGLDLIIADETYEALIEACIAYEMRVWDATRE